MNNRPSAHPTIEAASSAAIEIARRDRRRRLCIVGDQPHDGGFAIVDASMVCDRNDIYINVDHNGVPTEGRAALTLPINFTGALPH